MSLKSIAVFFVALAVLSPMATAQDASAGESYIEAYREIPMPEGFGVLINELEGPVFVNAEGQTLYKWPQQVHRNGYSGEPQGSPQCYDEVVRLTAGLMSPYPPGIELPDLENRPSCVDLWAPELVESGPDQSQEETKKTFIEESEIGEWSLVERADGSLQWAFDEQPLYTSIRDIQPGDAIGGSKMRYGGDSPAYRVPIAPPEQIPPGFAIQPTIIGRMLTTDKNESIYSYDLDSPTQSLCDQQCLQKWQPILAPALAAGQGEWSIYERSSGVRQWVFRGKPLYRYKLDSESWSQLGSDEAGWSNVFTQPAPDYPASFTRQVTIAGEVLATSEGKTIYRYFCGDDSEDQLACDHPLDTQVYRLAICGAGEPERCLEHWPYVLAGVDEQSPNRVWTILNIDPMTGRPLDEDSLEATSAIRVWAYRDRPVYTYGLDTKPGDVHGGGIGEWRGQRNGLRAFWLRDDFMNGILR